jgi:hypothetical protein
VDWPGSKAAFSLDSNGETAADGRRSAPPDHGRLGPPELVVHPAGGGIRGLCDEKPIDAAAHPAL